MHIKENIQITKLKKNTKNWMILGLITSVEEKNKLYSQTLKFPKDEALSRRYKDYKNRLSTPIEDAKVRHFEDKKQANSKNPNELWKPIDSIFDNNKPKTEIKEVITTTIEILLDRIGIVKNFYKFYSRRKLR